MVHVLRKSQPNGGKTDTIKSSHYKVSQNKPTTGRYKVQARKRKEVEVQLAAASVKVWESEPMAKG